MICNSNATVVSLDLSRYLQSFCVNFFVNRLHLVLQISKIPTQNFFALELNRAFVLVVDRDTGCGAFRVHGVWVLACRGGKEAG